MPIAGQCQPHVLVENDIVYEQYYTENQLLLISKLIEKDLSEPYSVFTYRYFVNNWPDLCLLAMKDGACVGNAKYSNCIV